VQKLREIMLSQAIVRAAGKGKQPRQPWYPRPSAAGPERCIRQSVYHARGFREDKPIGDRAILAMDDSSRHEELSADWISKTGYTLHSRQMEVRPFYDISGSIDGIIRDKHGTDRLWEHKAINHFTFEKYWKGIWPIDYFTQCCIYVKGLDIDVNEAILLIKNKNTAQYLDYLIRYYSGNDLCHIIEVEHSSGDIRRGIDNKPLISFPNIISNALNVFREINKHVKAQTLPDRPHEIGTQFPCGYCSWEDTCWQDYDKEFEKLSTTAELTQDWEERCKYYLETHMHYKDYDDEVQGLKSAIKEDMKKLGIRKGRVGKYIVHLMLINQKDGKSFERLQIRKVKGGD
jgi:hypothetical protein